MVKLVMAEDGQKYDLDIYISQDKKPPLLINTMTCSLSTCLKGPFYSYKNLAKMNQKQKLLNLIIIFSCLQL